MGLISKSQASTLPDGWIWNDCADGSGSLCSPEGVSHFSYDKNERTYDGGISYTVLKKGSFSYDGTLEEFKKAAESAIRDTLNNDLAQ